MALIDPSGIVFYLPCEDDDREPTRFKTWSPADTPVRPFLRIGDYPFPSDGYFVSNSSDKVQGEVADYPTPGGSASWTTAFWMSGTLQNQDPRTLVGWGKFKNSIGVTIDGFSGVRPTVYVNDGAQHTFDKFGTLLDNVFVAHDEISFFVVRASFSGGQMLTSLSIDGSGWVDGGSGTVNAPVDTGDKPSLDIDTVITGGSGASFAVDEVALWKDTQKFTAVELDDLYNLALSGLPLNEHTPTATRLVRSIGASGFCAGESFGVELDVRIGDFGAAAEVYSVEEQLPFGWTASGISDGGRINEGNSIRWLFPDMPLDHPASRTLVYTAVSPLWFGGSGVAIEGSGLFAGGTGGTVRVSASGDGFVNHDGCRRFMRLFTKAPEPVTGSGLDLFVAGPLNSIFNDITGSGLPSMDLFTVGPVPLSSGTDLFAQGPLPLESGLDLFLKVPEPAAAGISLFTINFEASGTGSDLFVEGAVPVESGVPLFLDQHGVAGGLDLFTDAADDRALLHEADALWYHPCEADDVEYVQSQVWSPTVGLNNFRFLVGDGLDMLGSGYRNPNSSTEAVTAPVASYDTADDSQDWTCAFWMSGALGSSQEVKCGWLDFTSSLRNAIGIETLGGGDLRVEGSFDDGAGITYARSFATVLGEIANDISFFAVRVEFSGGSAFASVSIDGRDWIDAGQPTTALPSGFTPGDDGDKVGFYIREFSTRTFAVDEVVLWKNTQKFQAWELSALYEIYNTHRRPMPWFGALPFGIPVESGIPLFTVGPIQAPDSMDLFAVGPILHSGDAPLFTAGPILDSGESPLFTAGPVPVSGDAPLFVRRDPFTGGLLDGSGIVFYHPSEPDDIEATRLKTWTIDPSGGVSNDPFVVDSGYFTESGVTQTDVGIYGSDPDYPTASGSDSWTAAFWMSGTTDFASVALGWFSGSEPDFTENNAMAVRHAGADKIVFELWTNSLGGGANASVNASGFGIALDATNFYVMRTEFNVNGSGEAVNLLLSVNGTPWNMVSGQLVNPFNPISIPAHQAGGKVGFVTDMGEVIVGEEQTQPVPHRLDEVAFWRNTARFTDQELVNLEFLGDNIGSGMDQYRSAASGGMFPIPNFSSSGINLFAQAGQESVWTAFMQGLDGSSESSVGLFAYGAPSGVSGLSFVGGSVPLFIDQGFDDFGPLPSSTVSHTMFMKAAAAGTGAAAGAWTVFMRADNSASSSFGLFMVGHPSGGPASGPGLSAELDLFLGNLQSNPSFPGESADANWTMFLRTTQGSSASIPFFMSGLAGPTGSAPLHVFGIQGSPTGSTNLFVEGLEEDEDSTRLFIDGFTAPASGEAPLFLGATPTGLVGAFVELRIHGAM